MNTVIVDGVAALTEAWPLVLLGLLVATLAGMAFSRAGRPAAPEVEPVLSEAGAGRTCRSLGHAYLRRDAGWCCSRCGDEVRHAAHQRTPQVAGV